MGHSGAGKSNYKFNTKVLPATRRKIFVDGQDIQEVTLNSLRSKISLVGQDIILFDDTVENNIKYAKPDASNEEIKKACKLSAADEFIETLPDKYQTNIGENGIRLSGGQKQRLSIARAMLKKILQ